MPDETTDAVQTVAEYIEMQNGRAYLRGSVDMLDALASGYDMISATAPPGGELEDFILALSRETRKMKQDIIAKFETLGVTLDG